jgi:hypothetical protein
VRWFDFEEHEWLTYLEFLLGLDLSLFEATHHDIPGDTAAGMALRIKKDLTVANIHGGCVLKIVHCQVEVVLLGIQ